MNNKYNSKNRTLDEESQIWEKQFLEITRRNCTYKLILGNIYRPPCALNDNYSLFNNELNLVLSQLNNLNCEVILAGDYNIDLLNIITEQKICDFFYMITCQSFFLKITLLTRLSERRGTLIDNFLCKLSRKTTNVASGILTKHISDHQPCFMTIDLELPKPSTPKLVKIKKHDTDTIANLQEELANINISDKLDHDTKSKPNKNYNIIDTIITSLITKHFPTKTVKFNKHKHKNNSWITKGIINSIYKDNLYKQLQQSDKNSPEFHVLKTNFKTYNKLVKQSIIEAEQMYYHTIFDKYKNNIKGTWSTIKSSLNRV